MNVDSLRITEILVLDKADVRYTKDGYLVANPRVGRIGIQIYSGAELGKPDMERVRVYRPEDEVMHKDAMSSIANRPITNNHPKEQVTADNWKKYGAGHTGDTVARDGEFVRVPIMVTDGATIKQYQDGKKELSLGYTSNLEWRQGSTPQGEAYDAVQTVIRVNHLAVVDAARGGNKLAIGDSISINDLAIERAKQLIADGSFERDDDGIEVEEGDAILSLALSSTDGKKVPKYPFASDGIVYRHALESIKATAAADQQSSIVSVCDQLLQLIDAKEITMSGPDTKMKVFNIDGVDIEMTDIAGSVVLRRMKHLEQEAGDLRSKLEADAARAKKDAEDAAKAADAAKKKLDEDAATIATLNKQLADAKAELSPEKIDLLVKDRAEVAATCRVVLGDKLVVDGKTIADMRKQVVEHGMGGPDAIKGWSEDAITASFRTLVKDVKPEQITAADSMRRDFSGKPPSATDRSKPYAVYDKQLGEAWKGDQQKTA